METMYNIVNLLKLISLDRINNSDWEEIGNILYNINPNLLPEFILFSKQSPNYQEGQCEYLWSNMYKAIYKTSVSCLLEIAKKDNPEKYMLYIADYIVEKYDQAGYLDEEIIGNMVYDIYKYEHIYIKGMGWYNYENNKWNNYTDNKYDIYDNNYTILNKFLNLVKFIVNNNNSKYQIFNKCLNYLNSKWAIRVDRINGSLKHKFTKPYEFMTLFDINRDLLGFTNGVYEIARKYFRMGYPSDYILMSTNYEYQSYDQNDNKINEFMKIMDTIFRDKTIKEDMFKYISNCLYNKKASPTQTYHWYGNYCSGKSTVARLLFEALGDYGGAMPQSLICGNTRDNNSETDIYGTKGKRLVIIEKDDNKINNNKLNSIMKGVKMYDRSQKLRSRYNENMKNEIYWDHYKNNDFILGRELYNNTLLLPIHHNLIIIDEAYETSKMIEENKLNHTKFESKFTHYPSTNDEIKMDPEMNDKIKNYKQIFMWLLLNKYCVDQ